MKEMNISCTADTALIKAQLLALLNDETDYICGLCNASAYLNEILDDINWVGFYLLKSDELVLGPFQGKVACTRISLNKGVCGAAATQKKTMRIDNVHEFEGHIACDGSSNSEIVCPIFSDGQLIGVLDIDSPKYNRFDDTDQINMETVASIIGEFHKKTHI